eukprot:354422-Chlamydomonas_euryale.AAC.5
MGFQSAGLRGKSGGRDGLLNSGNNARACSVSSVGTDQRHRTGPQGRLCVGTGMGRDGQQDRDWDGDGQEEEDGDGDALGDGHGHWDGDGHEDGDGDGDGMGWRQDEGLAVRPATQLKMPPMHLAIAIQEPAKCS